MSTSSDPQYDLGAADGLTRLAFGAVKILVLAAFIWIPVLVLAAPIGDRRVGVPAHSQDEGWTVRASQWASGLLWGSGVIALAGAGLAALAVPAATPFVFVGLAVLGLYIVGRRVAAADAIWLSPREWCGGMRAAITGPRSRWVAATISGSLILSTVLFLSGFISATPAIIVLGAAQVVGLVTSWRIGSRYATDVEWGQIQRERLGADVASILGVPLSSLDATQFMERDGVIQVWPVPPAARLRSAAELESRVASIRPELTVAEWSSEVLVLEIADHEVLSARERLASSGGLIGGLEPIGASSAFPDDAQIAFDFSEGFDTATPSLRKDFP